MRTNALSYDDILLVPQYSDIESREEVDLTSKFDSAKTLSLPLLSAPMDTVSEDEMANALHDMGAMGVIHRYNTIEKQVEVAKKILPYTFGAAIGATGDYMERAYALYKDACCDIFCIDVAHGHHILVKRAIEALRTQFGDTITLITGNVASAEGYRDLSEWGSDAIRIGVGPGSCCTTRINTGHGMPALQSIIDCFVARQLCKDKCAAIIADGGIRNAGDAVKALALGADFVMTGALLSGTDECPVKPIQTPTGMRVPLRGQASREAQMDWRGSAYAPEGISTTVPYKGSVKSVLRDFAGNLKSGLSYSGARNLQQLREKATYIVQTSAGLVESNPHILNRNQ